MIPRYPRYPRRHVPGGWAHLQDSPLVDCPHCGSVNTWNPFPGPHRGLPSMRCRRCAWHILIRVEDGTVLSLPPVSLAREMNRRSTPESERALSPEPGFWTTLDSESLDSPLIPPEVGDAIDRAAFRVRARVGAVLSSTWAWIKARSGL